MDYKTEDFKDRAELYAWASEKKDIECDGQIHKYGENGYPLAFNCSLSVYKKVIYPKTKQYWIWDVCRENRYWYRNYTFMDENGIYTNCIDFYEGWNEVKKRKVEDSLLEIDE